jgi:NPCBM/NEW2 domain-containing protein
VTIEFAKVAAVALNTDLARLTPPQGPHGRVVLANGARLTLASARCDGTTLTGKTTFDADLKLPVSELVALTVHGGAAVYLSDLKPIKEGGAPFLDVTWPVVADASVVKRDLRLGGSTYDKGLGMRAGRLTYALAGKYRRFEARIGLDERSPGDAPVAVRVRVLVDGKAQDLGPAAELTRIGLARPLRIDVTGARELTLIVEFAGTVAEGKFLPRVGAVPGNIDWADARVVK